MILSAPTSASAIQTYSTPESIKTPKNISLLSKLRTIGPRQQLRQALKQELLRKMAENKGPLTTTDLEHIEKSVSDHAPKDSNLSRYAHYKAHAQTKRLLQLNQSTEIDAERRPIALSAKEAGTEHPVVALRDLDNPEQVHLYQQPNKINAQDIENIKQQGVDPTATDAELPFLGKGSYGTVRLVQEITSEGPGKWFALKAAGDEKAFLQREVDAFKHLSKSSSKSNVSDKPPYLSAIAITSIHKPKISTKKKPYAMHMVFDIAKNVNISNHYQSLPPAEQKQFTIDLLEALQTLHESGIAHMDIKPENIMLKDGKPVLIDFGLATTKSQLDYLAGSPQWMAPEIYYIQLPIDAKKTDLYSMGLVLADMSGNNQIASQMRIHPFKYAEAVTELREGAVREIINDITNATPLEVAYSAMLITDQNQRPDLGSVIEHIRNH